MRRLLPLLPAALLAAALAAPAAQADPPQASIRFFGTGSGDVDRIKVRVAKPSTAADVSQSFTLEWWMKAAAADNPTGTPTCGAGVYGWITGHVIVDRDRFPYSGADGRDYGVSIGSDGTVAFGIETTLGRRHTVCTTGVNVLDGAWHHVAAQRRGRSLEVYVDGVRRVSEQGPKGSVKYPGTASNPRPNDPYLVLGAEKHDVGPAYPSYAGRMDEFRMSNIARYTGTSFPVPGAPFAVDPFTVLLFHFDAPTGPCTGTVPDAAGVSNGTCAYGGAGGPVHDADSPFA
jgi:hypothetical protein